MNDLSTTTASDIIESVVITGDLKALAPEQRVAYYNRVCQSLGLNPLTKPFDYITLNGKLTLYAKRDATDQLRRQYGVSVAIVNRERADGIFSVTAHATLPDGRTDESIGAVPIVYPETVQEWQNSQRITRPHPKAGQQFTGEDLANAYMKAETKAKRRVTLSIVGLGWLDETEVGSITDAQPATVNQATGEIVRNQVQIQAPAVPAAQPEPAISQTTIPDVGPMTTDQPRLTDWQRKALHAAGSAYYGKAWDDKRHALVLAVTKGRTQSSADLTPDEANALIDGINRRANADAAKASLGMMAMAEDVEYGIDPRDGMPFGAK